jgi:hypothetical protein
VVNDHPSKLFVSSTLDYSEILCLYDYYSSWSGSGTFWVVNLFWLMPPWRWLNKWPKHFGEYLVIKLHQNTIVNSFVLILNSKDNDNHLTFLTQRTWYEEYWPMFDENRWAKKKIILKCVWLLHNTAVTQKISFDKYILLLKFHIPYLLSTKIAQSRAVLSWYKYSGAPPSCNSRYLCTVMRIPIYVRHNKTR